MMTFLLITVGTILAYLAIGFILGIIAVYSNLAYYFHAGWYWKGIRNTVITYTILWGLMLLARIGVLK